MLKQNLNRTSHFTHPTSNKGITLIALIITIIVMLILVAVTISMAINGGLFEKAGKAVGETENAINKEQGLANGGIEIGGVWYDSIDDYIAGNPHKWTRTGDTFTCSHCGATYEMGQVVNYTPAGKTSTTISAEKSGAIGAQMIEAQDSAWIVLGIEDTDGDETYETLLITTAYPVGATENNELYFCGATAYNNGPSEINRICEELYSNSEYGKARGMTIEDVNRALNYTPHGGEYYDTSDSTWKTTGNLTTKLKDTPTWDNIKGNHQTPDGTNTEEALGNYELNGYEYDVNYDGTGLKNWKNDAISDISVMQRNVIFGTYSNDYWLASRGVYEDSDRAYFGPGRVCSGEVRSYYRLFESNGYEDFFIAGLRPVVSLKSKLPEKSTEQIEWGDWNPPSAE
ncbi:MAG: hypothetical protein ACI4U9_05015 [Clostridia bacterium]